MSARRFFLVLSNSCFSVSTSVLLGQFHVVDFENKGLIVVSAVYHPVVCRQCSVGMLRGLGCFPLTTDAIFVKVFFSCLIVFYSFVHVITMGSSVLYQQAVPVLSQRFTRFTRSQYRMTHSSIFVDCVWSMTPRNLVNQSSSLILSTLVLIKLGFLIDLDRVNIWPTGITVCTYTTLIQ